MVGLTYFSPVTGFLPSVYLLFYWFDDGIGRRAAAGSIKRRRPPRGMNNLTGRRTDAATDDGIPPYLGA